MPLRVDQSFGFQIGKMLGNLHLRLVEDGLEMADAQRRLRKQTENAQSRLVAEALVNSD